MVKDLTPEDLSRGRRIASNIEELHKATTLAGFRKKEALAISITGGFLLEILGPVIAEELDRRRAGGVGPPSPPPPRPGSEPASTV